MVLIVNKTPKNIIKEIDVLQSLFVSLLISVEAIGKVINDIIDITIVNKTNLSLVILMILFVGIAIAIFDYLFIYYKY
jgi:hypothetical protein